MSARLFAFAFLLVLTGGRLLLISRFELSPDEAYYRMWSERPDWAYYSKGPGVAWAVRAGTALGGDTERGVRFLAPWFGLGTSLLLWALARRLYGPSVAAWTVLSTNLVPLFNAGSLLMTPDAPSIFFWALAMAACWRALETAEARRAAASLGWWVLTGTAVGLGTCCKYTNLVEVAAIVLALAWTRRWRAEFRRPGLFAAAAVVALCAAPLAVWNANHAWVSWAHLRERGGLDAAGGGELAPEEFGKFLAALAGVYSPLVFLGNLVAAAVGLRRTWGPTATVPVIATGTGALVTTTPSAPGAEPALSPLAKKKTRFLLAFGLPLVVLYGLLAFRTAGEPNWTAPAFLSLGIWTTAFWHERAGRLLGRPPRGRGAAVLAGAALAGAAAVSLGMLNTDLLRRAGVPLSYHREPTARLRGWRQFGQAIGRLRRETEQRLGGPVFLIANKYQTAAILAFYLPPDARRTERPGDPPVYLPESQDILNQFSFWPRYDQFDPPSGAAPAASAPTTAEEEFRQAGVNPFVGRDALYVVEVEQARVRRLPSSLERGFTRCEPLAEVEVFRHEIPLRSFRVYLCRGYQTLPL